MKARRIIVSRHALERASERLLPDAALGAVEAEVRGDVAAAVEEDRCAKTMRMPGRLVCGLHRSDRIAWTPDGARIYVIAKRRQRSDGEIVLVVITAFDPRSLAQFRSVAQASSRASFESEVARA